MQDFQINIPFTKSTSSDGQLRLFGGIASSTSIDRDNERIDKGVLHKIANDLMKNSTVFFNHDTRGLGVGKVASAEVKGDEVHIQVIPTVAKGMADVVTQIQEGILKSFSIGGRIVEHEEQYDEKMGKRVRVIKNVECFEVSVVGVPSNRDASILSYITKSFKGDNMADEKKEEVKKEEKPGTETPAHEGKESYHEEAKEHGLTGYTVKCAKCNTEVKSCAKCGDRLSLLPEVQAGPAEMGVKKLFESVEFKKAMTEEFSKEYVGKIEEMKKEYSAKEEEFKKQTAALSARIEELHKSIDGYSKRLQAEEEEIQKLLSKEQSSDIQKGTDEQKSFAIFPSYKKY